MNSSFYSRTGKRYLDLAASGVGILLMTPILVIVAVAVKFSSSGPVFFRQIRVGRFGRHFRMFKFRSMKCDGDTGSSLTAAGDPRITPLGAWLRSTKLDELPQLFNVVLGQMSLVGPRPEVPEFTARYTHEQLHVLEARPGMTGLSANVYEEELLAQREDKERFYVQAVMPAKLETDLEYCDNIAFWNDFRILSMTFIKLLRRVDNPYKTKRHSRPMMLGTDRSKTMSPASSARLILRPEWLYTKTNQMILDGLAFAFSFLMAYVIRFDGQLSHSQLGQLVLAAPICLIVRLVTHQAMGIYRQVWKFISFPDVLEIAKSIAIGSGIWISIRLIFTIADSHNLWESSPFSVIVLEGFLSLSTSIGLRVLRRIFYVRQRKTEAAAGNAPPARVFLYGAGRAGIMLRKELDTNNDYEVIGFIDDDPRKVGSTISKTPVVGNGEQLNQLIERFKVDQVIISMATASRMTLSLALARCRRASISAKIIPSLQELISGQVHISQFRDTKVEEVLGRDSVEVRNFEKLAGGTYHDKRLLVTGAGGTIGSEAVRQLIRLEPACIGVLDIDENAIYDLQQELLRHQPNLKIQPVICDISDTDRLRAAFSSIRPEIVIHAASHKHVPLMELQPCEAVLNNVGGTKNVLEIARETQVERLVFISSDKAVNPVNVMGATKRIGELLVQAFMHSGRSRSACVRFGNVLGSQGSVIPLFKKQIETGGPITITHPDMVRYFMTVQEAVQLVLCAGTLADCGQTFVLDMGSPRNILELAREMILLAGLEPERDIETVIVGLRPGERLSEGLVAPGERLQGTTFEKLSMIQPQEFDGGLLIRNVSHLLQCARSNDAEGVLDLLLAMGLGYSSPTRQRPKALAAAASRQPSGVIEMSSQTWMPTILGSPAE